MRGGGDDAHTVLAGDGGHRPAKVRQVVARRRDGRADPGAHFDLALQELRRHLVLQRFLAGRKHGRRCLADEIARVRVDQEVLLLDAHGEARW